jgi:thiamine pyrophosphate-dependent acetolactate synthase large subunit-like protein
MATLIATNILLRSVQPTHPMHSVAVHALETLLAREEPLVTALQNVAEFWNAATRPVVYNGLGSWIEEAQKP